MNVPSDWKAVEIDRVGSFRIPPEASPRQGTPADSIFGVIDEEGYRIVYDYGRYGERVDNLRSRPGFSLESRRVGTRSAVVARFEDQEEDSELSYVRLLRVELDGEDSFTLRLSCATEEACELSDPLFASVELK